MHRVREGSYSYHKDLFLQESVSTSRTCDFLGSHKFTSTNLQVDDKYFYASDNKDDRVHGWVSSTNPPVGFWMIIPNDEFRTGGPYKQDLTSHVGPTVLSVSTFELIIHDFFQTQTY